MNYETIYIEEMMTSKIHLRGIFITIHRALGDFSFLYSWEIELVEEDSKKYYLQRK